MLASSQRWRCMCQLRIADMHFVNYLVRLRLPFQRRNTLQDTLCTRSPLQLRCTYRLDTTVIHFGPYLMYKFPLRMVRSHRRMTL